MSSFNTAFIGAGNMAGSIIGGLLKAGFDAASISAADPLDANLEKLREQGISKLSSNNVNAVKGADVVVLAVKPQVMKTVCEDLRDALTPGQLVVSIAAGIEVDPMRQWLGENIDIVRCMPNTPALLGEGASGLFAPAGVSTTQRERAATVLRAVGVICWVDDETAIHTVTALSGSGPAYFFQFMEAMISEAVRMGLDEESARTLCAQTCIGAGHMLASADVNAAELRRRVTSPGGTTERAVASFAAAGLEQTVVGAMRECRARSEEMGRELS